MATPSPQAQKVSALQKALANQAQSQTDAKAAGDKAKSSPTQTK